MKRTQFTKNALSLPSTIMIFSNFKNRDFWNRQVHKNRNELVWRLYSNCRKKNWCFKLFMGTTKKNSRDHIVFLYFILKNDHNITKNCLISKKLTVPNTWRFSKYSGFLNLDKFLWLRVVIVHFFGEQTSQLKVKKNGL